MATRGILYAVYLIPVIFSILFGSIVMADVLQEPDRELKFWRSGSSENSHDSNMQIIGLAQQYSTSNPVKILVSVDDFSFDCGDLYVTIYASNGDVVTQNGFLEQCFAQNKSQLPIEDEFSEVIDIPGQYKLVAEIRDKAQNNKISISEKFTVK